MDCSNPVSPRSSVPHQLIFNKENSQKAEQPMDTTAEIETNIKVEHQAKEETTVGGYTNQNVFDESSRLCETPSLDVIKTEYPISQIKVETNMDLQTTFKDEKPVQDVMNVIPSQSDRILAKEEDITKNYVEVPDSNVNLKPELMSVDELMNLFNSNANFPVVEINQSEPLLDDTEPSLDLSEVPEKQDVTNQTKGKPECSEFRKCFVKLKRLPPHHIKEMTTFSGEKKILSQDCVENNMPETPAVFPDGLSAIQTENGVWSARFLAKGLVFGPYDPPNSLSDRLAKCFTSNMKIKQGRQKYNMVAEIVEKYLYYRTVADIQPRTELICKIKHKHGVVVGKPGRGGKYFKCRYCKKLFVHRSKLVVHLRIHTGENPYKCHKCGRRYSQLGGLTRHVRDAHSSYRRKYKCKDCGKVLLSRTSFEYHMASHSGRVYKCPECGKQFAHKCGLRCHQLIHTGQKLHKCLQCPQKYYTSGNLNAHMKNHTDSRPYPCKECGKDFKRKEHLNLHVDSTHLGKKDHKCPICDKQFSQPGAVKVHMLIHTGEKPYECDICGKRFKEKADVTRHRRLHTGERPYKCDQCDKAYTSASNLTCHKKSHTALPKYECATCQSRFSTKRELKLHVLTHTGKKSYKCDKCGKGFLQHISLEKHMATHSEFTEKKHSCPKCDKSYFSEEYLQAHMKIHGRDETPKCNECGKIFTTFGILKGHMLTHLEKKPHQCDQCGQYFNQKFHLKRHLLRHSGEKSHKCDICGKDYVTASSLKTHMIIHTDKKNHKCDICGKSWFRKSDLTTHMRSHTGERPHECVQCGKRFPTPVTLKNHLLVHSGEKPHECEECGRCFAAKSNLNIPKRTHHA